MRCLVEDLYDAFEQVHRESVRVVRQNEFSVLTHKNTALGGSVCEFVIKSAGRVEQTCGGITTRLWDDPFEWTLPEYFSDKESLLVYLAEVEAVRNRAFEVIRSDSDLSKRIPAPDELRTLFSILLECLTASSKYLHLALLASNSDRSKSAENQS